MSKRWDEWIMVDICFDDVNAIRNWCEDVLWSNHQGSYHIGNRIAFFENEDDALWFKLVWCE